MSTGAQADRDTSAGRRPFTPGRARGPVVLLLALLLALLLPAAPAGLSCSSGASSPVAGETSTAPAVPGSDGTRSLVEPTTGGESAAPPGSAPSSPATSPSSNSLPPQIAGLPAYFPPLDLPPESTVLSSTSQEVGDGGTLSRTVLDSPQPPGEQYRGFLRGFERLGYEVVDQHLTEGERLSAYVITATRGGVSVTVTGGRGSLGEESPELAKAQNPFQVTVEPAGAPAEP